ncbi:MAG: hypothetical protein K2Q32_01080 [Alphaproteobacteria bacterium]|nr:hypothetical protein [Alphaproteobacteria bacterium]
MRLQKLFMILAAVFMLSASGSAHSQDVGSMIKMGTSYCPEAEFDCSNLSSQQTAIVEAANQCVGEKLKLKEMKMSNFTSSGEFENCVQPSEAFVNGSGTVIWVTCCVKKESETCQMYCTTYAKQKN